ncbi:MAG: helix-turn-helix transcriptional regulator [Neptuniibacter sp.]
MDIKVAFGQVLREVRKEKNISQEQLALQSDIDRTYISKLERGKYQPTLETILALAPVLGCPPAELVERVEKLLQN